jgi:outer membrane protein assembly factor BamB
MPHQGHHKKGGFASASPVTDGKHIYVYFGSFGLYCYDFEGRFVWKREFEPQAIEDSLGEGSSPALHGDTLVIVVDHELQSYVLAIDKRTGQEIWKQDREEPSNWSTPRILTHAGRRQVVVNGKTVRAYDLATGELLWRCGGHTAGAIPMPAVGHGLVFTASGWRKDVLQAIELGQRGDLTDSESVVWSLDRGTPYVPCPMLWGEEIYLLDDQTFFSCFNATDGAGHYVKQRLPGMLNFSASPVGAADRIYLLSEEGKTVVVQRGPQLKVLAINELDEMFYASPAIVGDAMYLRGKKHLYCFAKSPH